MLMAQPCWDQGRRCCPHHGGGWLREEGAECEGGGKGVKDLRSKSHKEDSREGVVKYEGEARAAWEGRKV